MLLSSHPSAMTDQIINTNHISTNNQPTTVQNSTHQTDTKATQSTESANMKAFWDKSEEPITIDSIL